METGVVTLFEDKVPICVRYQEREHTTALSTIRIDIATKAPAQRKILHVQITDEKDPFFFYSLDVTEEDFQGLKNEQSLKPDFATFPMKLIELLRSCINCAREPLPLYSADLVHHNSQWTLQIVKIDDFKNLVPLSLVVRAGNDATIKKYLAGKLTDFRVENATLQSTLEEARNTLLLRASTAEAHANELSKALEAKSNELARITTQLRAEISSATSQEREKSFNAQQEIVSKAEEERRAVAIKHEATVAQLTETVRRLEQDNKDLLDAKYRLDADVKDLTAQLHTTRVEVAQYKQEGISIRAENKSVSHMIHEHEKEINQQKVKIAALDQQILDKDELLKKMTALLDATNMQKASLEETATHIKSTSRDMEERIAVLRGEIKKGNQIIATLQTALKASKLKVAQKDESLHRLQEEITAKERQMLVMRSNETHAISLKEASQRELEQVKESEATLSRRLEECRQVISKNNDVIEFLQRELLKMKEGTLSSPLANHDIPITSSAPASSYKFRAKYTPPNSLPHHSSVSSQSPSMLSAPVITTPKDVAFSTSQPSFVYGTPSTIAPTNPPSTSLSAPSPHLTPFSVAYNPPVRKGVIK